MFIITTANMVKTKGFSMGTKERIIAQTDSGDSGKDCKAIIKVLGVPVATVKDILNKEKEHCTSHPKGSNNTSEVR